MAMVSCSECGGQISSDAFKCPKCGKILKNPQRTTGGKIIKLAFIFFNILMAMWIIAALVNTSGGPAPASQAEEIGRALGTGLGIAAILTIWAIGDVILGIMTLLTRPKI